MLVRPAHRTLVIIALLFRLGALAPIVAAQAAGRPTRVLLVFQQQAETRPMVEFTQRLRLTLQAELASPVEFYQESLDLDRFGERDRLTSLAAYFDNKYRGFGVDVVVPVGGRALRFVLSELGDVFASAPVVVALAAPPTTALATLPRNVTGRLGLASRFGATIAMARSLQPDAIQIVIVGGASPQDSASVSAVVNALAATKNLLPVSVLQGLALEPLLNRLRELPLRSIVFFANYRGDDQGQAFEPLDIIGSIARASSAPMYTQLLSYVGEGVVGGSVTSFEDEGTQTARLIIRVLRRPAGAPMPPVENSGNSFVVDERQLRRWGLSEARLPRGTEVLFREPTAWQRYRTAALFTFALITAEALLIGLLLLERRRRIRVQLALDDQAAYEQMTAKLTADAAHHSLDGASRGLDAALARVATYAHASAAMLVEYSETRLEPVTRIFWPPDRDQGNHAAFMKASAADEARLEIPLTADGASMGMLALRRMNDGRGWAPDFVRRIEAAGEILAAALARSRAARAIEDAKRQVAHMARVALVGELAATMSHELRQPLAAIRANAEAGGLLLARSPSHSVEAREIFQHIVADDVRAVEVIEGVRRLLRKDDRVAKAVDLNEVCRDAIRLLENDAKIRHTRLDLTLAPTVPLVMGDPVQLQQAVLNLALNGLEAASTSARERSVLIETKSCGSHVEVAVHDTGPGIPASVVPHLFESFFSTKDSGLGLGLVIVRSIVERHNGRIRAENSSSGGAAFRVRLPAVHDADPTPTPTTVMPHERDLTRETVARE